MMTADNFKQTVLLDCWTTDDHIIPCEIVLNDGETIILAIGVESVPLFTFQRLVEVVGFTYYVERVPYYDIVPGLSNLGWQVKLSYYFPKHCEELSG